MKINFNWSLLLVFTTIVLIIGCKSSQINTAGPGESYIPVDVKPQPSNFIVNLNVQVKDIEKIINDEVSGLLYADTSFDNNNHDNLKLKVWKREPFKIALRGNELSYRIPLKIWANAGFKIEKFGFMVSDYREFNAEIALQLRTRFSVNGDWSLSTTTVADSYEWIKEPTVKIAGFNMPVGFVADAVLAFSLKSISKSIDKTIASGQKYKSFIEKTWQDLQKPRLISEDYKIWLKITPLQMSTPPISSYNNKINQKIFIQGFAETFIGKEPNYTINPKLPPLKLENPDGSQFEVNLMNEISFSEADSLANQYLKGKIYSSGNKTVTVLGVRIYGSQGKLVAETTVTGSLNGKLYFTGIPYFDRSDSTLKLKDFDFDLKTKNILVKSANWLLNSKFDRMIEKQFCYPLSYELKMLKTELENGLTDQNLGMGFKTSSKLKEINVEEVFLTQNGIKSSLHFKGSLSITSESFYKTR